MTSIRTDPSVRDAAGGRSWPAGAVAALLVLATIRTPPLYHSNQNTKFLHGLADALPARLGGDWTAGTADGLPVFSALVAGIARVSGPWAFHALEGALLAIFAMSFVALARHAAPQGAPAASLGIALAGLLAVLASDSQRGALDGVAEQYMVGGFFQPSEFGILYLPALLLAADGRRGALLLAAIPAAFHPAYILLSAVLIATMLWHDRRAGRTLPRIETVAALLVLLLPPLDLALRFAPTDPETFARANAILAFERIPHHSDPAHWAGIETWRKLAVALLALGLAPPGLLRAALAALLALAAAGTAAVALTGNAELALVAPWRLSILIVPLSVAIVSGALLGRLFKRLRRPSVPATLAALALAAGGWAAINGAAWKRDAFADAAAPADHVAHIRRTAAPGDVYLTDVRDEEFRLDVLAPQYVSWKTHPYRDVEVLEWRARIDLARAVFGGSAGTSAGFDCAALERLLARDRVSHVVVGQDGPGHGAARACATLAPEFEGESATVFAVRPRR